VRFPPRHIRHAWITRLASFICLACAATGGVGTLGGVTARAATANPLDARRAAVAMAQLDRDFFDAHRGFYTVTHIAHGPIASVWPTSQVLAAAIDLARLSHEREDMARVDRIIASLRGYLGPGGVDRTRTSAGRRFTDDNTWIALDLLDTYDMTRDASLLPPVERIFAFVVANWDTRHGGGLLWADGHLERCTASNGPAITVGLRLAAITGKAYYRTWADRIYAWENAQMRRPDGLYWDHIYADGRTVDRDIVSYNQGVMIDANLAYARLTGQRRYLGQARRIADAAARALPAPWRSRGMYANFDAIYVWSLAHLNAVQPGAAGMAPVQEYLTWAWPLARAPRVPAHRTEYDLLEQAGYVMEASALAGHQDALS
jgi:hypothetical protein